MCDLGCAGEGGIWDSSPTRVPSTYPQAPKAKRKAESWERSVGTLGNRPPLSGLVVVKKTDPGRSTRQGQASPTPGRCSGVPGSERSTSEGRQVAAAPPVLLPRAGNPRRGAREGRPLPGTLASLPGPRKSGKAADPAPWTPGTSSLSQLGAYSDSEDSSGSS